MSLTFLSYGGVYVSGPIINFLKDYIFKNKDRTFNVKLNILEILL